MRHAWFVIRAVGTTVAVVLFTALISSAVLRFIYREHAKSKLGEIERGIKAMTPDVQRRDKEVEELTRP